MPRTMMTMATPTINAATVSVVRTRERLLRLRMVKRLHGGRKVPYESLLTEVS